MITTEPTYTVHASTRRLASEFTNENVTTDADLTRADVKAWAENAEGYVPDSFRWIEENVAAAVVAIETDEGIKDGVVFFHLEVAA